MKLYKKDTKGKLRILDIWTKDNVLYQESGLFEGKLICHSKECKSKNVGKSNETTPEHQAILEAEALITKKLTEGYFQTIAEVERNEVILPMLAKEYNKEKHKIDWSKDVFVQPKLDGMRALGSKKTLISRNNKKIDTLAHIADKLNFDNIIDGEAYIHGLSFQENMKLIKKYRPGKSEDVKYHVYDIISEKSFFDRYHDMLKLVKDIPNIIPVRTIKITSEEELKELHKEFLAQGYEGTIIRHGEESYKINGRSSNLLKYKDFQDITLPIKDVIPGEQSPNQGYFIFDWESAVGHPMGDNILGCGMKFSHEEREEFLTNKDKYIGLTAELRFFEYSDTGVPRFPQCVGIREDK